MYFVEEAAYLSGAEVHTLYALDIETGNPRWTAPVKGRNQWFGYVEDAADGKVWLRDYGTKPGESCYRVFDAADGKQLAEFTTAVDYKSVIIRDGVFYGVDVWAHVLVNEAGEVTPDSYLVALDALTGAPLWKSPKQELAKLDSLFVDGSTLVAIRYPASGSKLSTAVLAFQTNRP